jgi:uncharacterized membrane protein
LDATGSGGLPRWEYLLSHHSPERWHRTLAVRRAGRVLHLCARCLGQAVGSLAWVSCAIAALFEHFPMFSLRVQAVVALLPMAAALDWATQSMTLRESTNQLRVASGAMLGFALTDLVGALIARQWFVVAGGIGVLAIYAIGLTVVLWVSGAWRRVLEQHFPGVEVGSPAGSSRLDRP